MKTKIILLLLIGLLMGCNNKKDRSPKEDENYYQNQEPVNPSPNSPDPPTRIML